MVPLEALTVGQLLRRTAARYPEAPAVWYTGKFQSYLALNQHVRSAAARLLSLEVRPGTHIALLGELDPEMLTLFYAIQDVGCVAVMLNTSLGNGELLPLLIHADIRYLFVGRSYKSEKMLLEQTAQLPLPPCVQELLTVGGLYAPGRRSLSSLPSVSEERLSIAEARVSPADTALILFTSGSTGLPKAVMSSHYSRVNGGIQQAHDMGTDHEDRFCVTMPIFHCFCISVNLMASLAVGGCLCIPKDRHTASITETVFRCGCTVLSSVPTMFHALISKKEYDPRKFSTVRTGIIGGAFYSPEEFLCIERAIGPQFCLLSSLGQTETTAGLTICDPTDPASVRSRTVGHFMDHVEGKIADVSTGKALPVGSCGEICVRGYLTMQGYYKNPGQTAKTLDADGWVHTGDLGVLDTDGNITLKGRLKELIIRGGENISPCEIETALLSLPQISRCKVVGVPDTHYGEEVCACIQLCAPIREDTIRAHLRAQLADYKIPRFFLFWDTLPLTASGKVSGAKCKEQACRQLLNQNMPVLS